MPGIMPAANSSPTETSAITPYRTMMMLGGMTGPMQDEAAVTAALKLMS